MLGADDKAGVATVLSLALRLEHTEVGYALFFGEEVGCQGSEHASRILTPKAVISVDRAGTDEVIYAQLGQPTASQYTAQWLADELGMGHYPSPNGVYTDSATFAGVAHECLNLAAGYWGAHTNQDTQDLVYLDELVEALAHVPWGDFPLVRTPREVWRKGGVWGWTEGIY